MVDTTISIEQVGSEVTALESLARALEIATYSRLMSLEHGGAVWKKYLKDRGFDVPRTAPVKEPVKKETDK